MTCNPLPCTMLSHALASQGCVLLQGLVASVKEQLRHRSVNGVAEGDGSGVFPCRWCPSFWEQDRDVWKVAGGAFAFV